MNEPDIDGVIAAALNEIAPEIDTSTLSRDASLREEAELDSMDFLNFVVALHERLGIDIPESDYAALATLDDCVAYLAQRLG
ncbi:MAG: acyl carrier protein [Gammaproteobacteria bacterium]|jgi:acyl carrier protein